MTLLEQIERAEKINGICYGCFNITLKSPIEEKMCMRHIAGKMDYISSLGNHGNPKQFLYLFREICDYLNNRNIKHKLKYRWTSQNNFRFNLECLYLFVRLVMKC